MEKHQYIKTKKIKKEMRDLKPPLRVYQRGDRPYHTQGKYPQILTYIIHKNSIDILEYKYYPTPQNILTFTYSKLMLHDNFKHVFH